MKSNINAARILWLTLPWLTLACSRAPEDGATAKKHGDASPREEARSQADSPPATKAPRPPNILLISLDTVRSDRLSCYGYERPTTPNLDRLAEQSVRFAQCRTPATWTLPAHMSLFTSLLPTQHTVDNLNRVLPRRILTLPEALQQHGYTTAALVNNGQMRAHWGFDRGFDLWREFEVDTPAAAAGPITDEALAWLRSAPSDKPHFLFLHYYDAHDPYDAPPEFREKFGVRLSGMQCRELCFAHRSPQQPPIDPAALEQLQRAYDADLAQLDAQLGRLFAAVADDTLIVVFSDHGEAFSEHGWLLHGATLYDEEVRVPLLVRLPRGVRGGQTVEDSVSLIDVAPTLLAAAALPRPRQFQGENLLPAMSGAASKPRLVLAESKGVLEGRFTRSAVLYPLKGILSIADGSFELYRLPDERENLAAREPELAAPLRQRLEAWLDEEACWVLHAAGEATLRVEVTLANGTFALFLPLGFDPEQDQLEVSGGGQTLTWIVAPAAAGATAQVKKLWLEPSDPQAALRLHVSEAGEPVPQRVYVGASGEPIVSLPAMLPADLAAASPASVLSFVPPAPGLYVQRYAAEGKRTEKSEAAPLDAETIRQLKGLGYLK